jgi:ATP-binding cassette, subfamily B, bacterial MsbA
MFKLKIGILADDRNRTLLGRVLKENFHLYRIKYALVALFMLIEAGASFTSIFLMREIVAIVIEGKPVDLNQTNSWFPSLNKILDHYLHSSPGMGQVVLVSLSIIATFFIKGLADYCLTVTLSIVGNNIVARQQQRIGDHILKQSLAFFGHFPSSDLITRISNAASSARDVMNTITTRLKDFVMLCAYISAMFVIEWKLSIIALFVLTPIILLIGGLSRRLKKIGKANFLGIVQVIGAMQEAILGNKLIKSYNLEPQMRQRFHLAITGVERISNKMSKISSRSSPIMETMGGVAIATIVLYAGYRKYVLNQNVADLIGFLTALLIAYEPIKNIARMNIALQQALIGVNMLYNVLDTDHSIPDVPNAKQLIAQKGEIRLRNITFSYRPDQPVLHNVSLVCPSGSVTALVGPSGSGKSTIFNLIERFYQPDSGIVEIDEQDTSQCTTVSLRDQMSLVSQDTFLFSDTLRNNIRFARMDATNEEIEEAARSAFAHDFILDQPQGYDTQVGENGGSLSGGQRQRISIARAFLKNAPILLLDEATSALDSESEQKIQVAFDQLMKGRTTIVIAHRFSTIRNAQTIHVMKDGRLAASGSHQELISDADSLYAHLYRLQYEEHLMPI